MSSFADRVKNLVNGNRDRDEYKPVQMEEAAESRVSLSGRGRYTDNTEPNADVDAEASVGLLTRESDAVMEDEEERAGWKKKEKSRFCVCCGVDYRTPSKILGGLALLSFIFAAYKLLAWAFYEPPMGHEHPEFGTSLGCHNAPYLYNNTQVLKFNAPMHPDRFDHGVDFRGGAVGTVTLTSTSTNSPNVQYEITIRSNDNDRAQDSVIRMPTVDERGTMFSSMATISTSWIPKDANPGTCIRYDVKIIVPPSLKKLHLGSHTLTHVKLDKDANIKMDDLFVTLFTTHTENMIQSSKSVKSNRLNLQVTRGYIVGDVSIVDQTNLITQRGDGELHVDVYPEPPRDKTNPEVASLDTTTGAGRTNVVVHKNKGVKRPINAGHISSRNGPMEFTYKDAKISGLVAIEAAQLKQEGLESLDVNDMHEGEKWGYYVGSKDGKDRISVSSRAWVGLYF